MLHRSLGYIPGDSRYRPEEEKPVRNVSVLQPLALFLKNATRGLSPDVHFFSGRTYPRSDVPYGDDKSKARQAVTVRG